MQRRPLLVGGLVATFVGALLLSLGLGRGGEGVTAASPESSATDSVSPSAPGATSPAVSPSGTPSASVAASPKVTPTPSPTRAVRKATQAASPAVSKGPRLRVASIGLDVPLRSGGVSSSGRINPPAGKAMWVRGYGRVEPGKVGTAVVAGHVAASGKDDVFADLSRVRVGQKVVITSGSVTRTYVVKRAAVVKKAALTHDVDVWGKNTTKRRIVLVTCDDELGYRSDGHRVANYVVVAEAI